MAAGSVEQRLVGLLFVDGQRVGEVSAAALDSANPVLEVTLLASADQATTGGTRRKLRPLVPLQAPYVELTEDSVELTDPPAGLLETD